MLMFMLDIFKRNISVVNIWTTWHNFQPQAQKTKPNYPEEISVNALQDQQKMDHEHELKQNKPWKQISSDKLIC